MELNYPIVVAKVRVTGSNAEVLWSQDIPKGLVGGRVLIEYADSCWDGLNKTVVFRGAVTKDVLENGPEVIIPSEVLSRSGINLYVGVYGTNAENKIGIPTFWAKVGVIRDAADPDDDPLADSSLPVWAKLLERRPDWNAPVGNDNHIRNRTHWKELKVGHNIYDGSLDGRICVSIQEGMDYIKISDRVLTEKDLIGSTVVVHAVGDPPSEFTMEITEDLIYDLRVEEGVPVIAAYEAVMCVQSDFTIFGLNVEKGVYFLRGTENGELLGYVKSITALPDDEEVFHKLDNRYLNADWTASRVDGCEIILHEADQEFYSYGDCRQTFPFALETGEEYVVTWDGEKHSCHCTSIMLENFALPCMGNMHFFNEDYPDTGEPFGIVNIAILQYNLGTLVYGAPTNDYTTHTISIERIGNVRNRLPSGYMPSTYTFPSDLYYSGIDRDQLTTAYFHLRNGGAVKAMYQNDLYSVMDIYLDILDGWYDSIVLVGEGCIRIWSGQRGWVHYEPYKFTLCTSDYDENHRQGKKFEITINNEGDLETRLIASYSTE